jgi:hypothetical protein
MPAVALAVALGLAGATLAACGDEGAVPGTTRRNELPTAEFLVAAGDSTYWVRSRTDGLRVRGAALLLTRSDDSFHEIRIIEEVIDYADAEFVREQMYGYRLGMADSVLLFDNTAVSTALRQWLEAHPGEQPVDPEVEDLPEPESSATDFLEVIDVHGPWLSWAYALDIDMADSPSHTHQRKRGVVDIRTGATVLLDTLMSASEAARIAAIGRASLDTLLSVVREANDDRARRARETLHTFVFDPAAFSITDVEHAPAIVFHVAGVGSDGEALELLLPPIVLDEEPEWWRDVRPTLPIWGDDSLNLRWSPGGHTVVGAVDSARTRVALSIIADSTSSALGKLWPLATVPMPAYQFIALDTIWFDIAARDRLERAFDRASGDDPYATRALAPASPRRMPRAPFRHVLHR